MPGMPQPPSVSPASALNEADFRAIAASLAGALPLAPQVTAATAPAAVPASSSAFNAENGGPWAAAPQIPPAAEMYSFPWSAGDAIVAAHRSAKWVGSGSGSVRRTREAERTHGPKSRTSPDSTTYSHFRGCPAHRFPVFRKRPPRSPAYRRHSQFLERLLLSPVLKLA